MKRALFIGILGCACSAPAAPDTPALPVPAAPDQAAADSSAETSGAWTWRASDLADDAQPRGYLLGVGGQSGLAHCPDGGYESQWLDVQPTIGRVRVSGPPQGALDPLLDQPVLAIGRPSPAPSQPQLTVQPRPCMPMQMRSDWRSTPRGILIERSPVPTVEHFSVDAARPLHELRARLDGDSVLVELTNPVPRELEDVELRVHYEGCFGKPGSMVRTESVGGLGVGAKASARMPVLEGRPGEPEGRARFAAYSVHVVATGTDVVIDLDARLSSLGVHAGCPEP
ncbi:MAG: hypothetical protein AB1Z98_25490 [Nannocystaceae bacterium]